MFSSERFKDAIIVGAIVALVIVGIATAEQLIGVGSGYWSSRVTVPPTSAPLLNPSDAGFSGYALFPAGEPEDYRVAHIVASAAGQCAFVGDPDSTIGTMTIDSGGSNGVGAADVRSFKAAGQEWWARPGWYASRSKPGGVPGICNTARTNVSGEFKIYEPCAVDGDCTSGTCRTSGWTQDQLHYVGLYLVCASDTSSVAFDVRKEVIRR